MNVIEFKKALEICFEAKMPLLGMSMPGVGKTTVFESFAQKLSNTVDRPIGLITDLNGATASPAEMGNIKYIKADFVHDAEQSWVPTKERIAEGIFPEEGIIFIDEIADSGMLSVQSAFQKLFNEKKVGSAKVGDGWFIGAATNRVKDKAAAGRLSTALINRAMVVTIDPDADILYDYFVEKGMSVATSAFLRFRPDCINDFDPSSRAENPQFCSPRSLEALDNVVKHMPEDIEDNLKLEMISGIIGDGRGSEYFGFLKIFHKLPNLNNIIKDPENHPVPVEVDVKIAVAQALIHRATKKNVEAIMKFFVRLPADIGVVSVTDLLKQCKDVALTQTFKVWAAKNSDLIL